MNVAGPGISLEHDISEGRGPVVVRAVHFAGLAGQRISRLQRDRAAVDHEAPASGDNVENFSAMPMVMLRYGSVGSDFDQLSQRAGSIQVPQLVGSFWCSPDTVAIHQPSC